jgi:hypothetical protein
MPSPRRCRSQELQINFIPHVMRRQSDEHVMCRRLAALKPKPVYYGPAPKPKEPPNPWANLLPMCVRQGASWLGENMSAVVSSVLAGEGEKKRGLKSLDAVKWKFDEEAW